MFYPGENIFIRFTNGEKYLRTDKKYLDPGIATVEKNP